MATSVGSLRQDVPGEAVRPLPPRPVRLQKEAGLTHLLSHPGQCSTLVGVDCFPRTSRLCCLGQPPEKPKRLRVLFV